MATLEGTLLNGRYRLDEKVGAGGMSTVYRAFDTTLERTVAIKVLHRDIASDSDNLERFRREARAVAQLSHPHIVTVIDASEDDNRPYIVFEFVAGETLKQCIRRNDRLEIVEALAYAIEIARALGAAHSRGIVHRDVKPQNVLIDGEGRAKVTDFGIARTLEEDGLTADGRVLGTTDYVSPEQAMGQPVNGQSDLYSLGIVLFEMLTGDVPFKGDNQIAVAMKHVREALPDVRKARPEVSAATASILDHSTHKDPRRRYADDAAFIADLEEALGIEAARAGVATGEATSVLRTLPRSAARRVPLRVRRPWVLFALLGLTVAGVVLAIVLAGTQAERGTGNPNAVKQRGLTAVSLAQDAASDFDPAGDRQEHSSEADFVLDRDPATFWSTERYSGGSIAGKPGVGIHLDANPGVAARRLVLRTPTPGLTVSVYAAKSGPPGKLEGWSEVARGQRIDGKEAKIDLDTAGQALRYYLVWITKLPEGGQAKLSELYLFR